jgi:hypothetical protein
VLIVMTEFGKTYRELVALYTVSRVTYTH